MQAVSIALEGEKYINTIKTVSYVLSSSFYAFFDGCHEKQ
jgi:hypothetical protein